LITPARAIREYLDEHPYKGEKVETGDVTVDSQDMRLLSPAPMYLMASSAILDMKTNIFSFAEGVLTINLLPAPLRYRPLYMDEYDSVALERIDYGGTGTAVESTLA
jgi:hypothetical protein